MAITILKRPLGIYPAYNDSFIKFNSSLSGLTKAVIKILPVERFPKPFEIFPNPEGEFYFNLKAAVLTRFNENGFKDFNGVYSLGWGDNIEGVYLLQKITIQDFNDNEEQGDELEVQIEFYKSVKQVGEVVFTNTAQVLSNSENGVDFNLSYFEGFPFFFSLQRVSAGASVSVYSRNSGILSQSQESAATGAFRLWVDKQAQNWTSSNFMPLNENVNRLEVRVNGVFKSNLNLKKVSNKCGVYLKWANNEGDFNFFLFEEFFNTDVNASSLKEIATNPLKNISEGLVNESTLIGKKASKRLNVKARVDRNEFALMESLSLSPSVQMYSSRVPYEVGEFIDVEINGGVSGSNKKEFNVVEFVVILPEVKTLKL